VPDIHNITADEFDCLWTESYNLAKGGKTTVIVGTAFLLVGGITMIAANPCCSSGFFISGSLAVFVGGAINIFGIPIWIVGADRKSKLKESIHYKNQALKTLRISPVLQRNQLDNTPTFGITATINF
jgi:hypothetical protein